MDLALILQGVIRSEERRRPASLKGNLALRCILDTIQDFFSNFRITIEKS